MTSAITQIDITAKDSTAAAFASANNNLKSLGSSAASIAAQIAGVGISIAGVVSGIKEVAQATIQLQQFTSTLQVGTGSARGAADALSFVRSEAKRLGLDLAVSADQFAKLAAASKGTALQGKATRDIFSAMSEAATVLGLSADQTRGALNAFQQMISKGKVQAEELRGQLGERLPGAFGIAARAMGVTTSELDKLLVAGKITAEDLLPKMAQELNRTFGPQAEQSAKGLSSQINRMNTAIFDLKIAIGESGLIDFLSSGIELATKLGNALTNAFNGDKKLSAVDKQVKLIGELESQLERMQGINAIIPISDFIFSKKESDEIKFRIDSAKEDLEKLKAIASAPIPGEKPTAPGKIAADSKNATDALKELRKQQDESLRREHEYIKLLEIERKQRIDLIKPYEDSAKKSGEQLHEIEHSITALKYAKDNQVSLQVAVEKTTIARLEEKKAAQQDPEIINQINAEIEARQKIVGLIPLQKELQEQTQSTTDQLTELWKQAGRNIQTSLASSIFDFFNGGLGNMVQNVKNAVLRIMSEFAALKISQAIGLDKIFSVGAVTSGISSGGSLLSAASIGSNAIGLVRGGLGANSLIGGALSFLPGEVGAFGSGLAGGAIAGVSSPAALAGSSFAAISGPLIAAFAATQGLKMLAGDKRLGGAFGGIMNKIGDIPIIGDMIPIIPILNGLFGRGPLKQKETQLTGDVGIEGLLSAYLTTNFKAKGGLLVGGKHDFAGVNLLSGTAETDNKKLQSVADGMLPYAANLAGTLKSSVLDITTQVKSVSAALNISLDPLKDFHHQINLISESGKALTDEQISGEISSIGDDIVTKLMPSIRDLSKNGETALQTFSRLGAEFQTLTNAATILGKSVSEAQKFISSTTYEGRSAFIDAAGGIDALNQKVSFFAQNFLTSAEQLAPVTEQVNNELSNLGISTSITKNQFRDLVQSYGKVNGITESTLQSLLNLAPAFIQVRSASDQLRTSSEQLAKDQLGIAFSALQKSVNTEKEKIAKDYNEALKKVNDQINDVTSSIDKLRNLSDSLKATVSDIFPLSRDAARRQVQGAIATAKSGGALPDADSLRGALGVLGKIDPGSYRSALDFAREKGSTANILSDLGKLTDNQITIEERSLTALRNQSSALTLGFESQTSRLDSLVTQGQLQIDALNGIDTSVLTVAAAISKFNSASAAAGGGSIGGGSTGGGGGGLTSGNPSISAQQIRDIAATPGITDMQLYQTGVSLGVSFDQYAAATGANVTDLNKWADDHGVPRFAKGGLHRGGLRIVGENGPELEYTPPSRIFNNADARDLLNPQQNKELIDAITELREQLIKVEANTRAGALHGSTTAGILRRVTPDGDKIATGAAA